MSLVGCGNGWGHTQINVSAADTQEPTFSWHATTLITQGRVAPSVASKPDPRPIVSRTKQDQKTRSTVAMSLTRLGLHAPPSAGCVKSQVGKIFSGDVAANPLLGIFGTTTPGGRSTLPAGRLMSATPAARTPPRPWEARVLLLALLLATSVNGKSFITHIKVLSLILFVYPLHSLHLFLMSFFFNRHGFICFLLLPPP